MKRFLLIVSLLIVAFTAVDSFAAPDGTKTLAGGGFRFAPVNSIGPVLLEARADGTATIYIVSSVLGGVGVPNTVRRYWPSREPLLGDNAFPLDSGEPRPFSFSSDSIDSCFVVLGTATEVDISWTNAN